MNHPYYLNLDISCTTISELSRSTDTALCIARKIGDSEIKVLEVDLPLYLLLTLENITSKIL